MVSRNEIMKNIATLKPEKVVGGSPGLDNSVYVFDFKIENSGYPKDSGIWVVLHPKETPGYVRSLYNEIISKNRQGDFEVGRASVYAMLPSHRFDERKTEGMESEGFEFSLRDLTELPDNSWNIRHIIIERHLEKSLYPRGDVNAGQITESVARMDKILRSMRGIRHVIS